MTLAQISSPAATINFKNPVTCSGDVDAFPLGQAAYAYDWGTATTVNGVAFTATTATGTVGGGNVSLGSFTTVGAATFVGTNAPYTSLSAAYQNVLKGAVYNSSTTPGITGTVTLNNLVPGHLYELQLWVNDSRNVITTNRVEWIYDGSGGVTNVLAFNATHTSGGLGQYILGTFVADDTGSQSFILDNSAPGNPQNNNAVQMNALQLRDLSSVWSGTTSGAWADSDTTSANFSGSSYSTVKGTGLTNVYFADTDASGNPMTQTSVTVGAGGASGMNVVFLNKALVYTFNSADATGIAGGNDVTLSGTNVVAFNGANTYSGNTTLGSNARLVIGPSGSIASSASIALGANATLTLGNSRALSGSSTISLAAGSVLDASSSSLPLGSSQTLSGYGTINGNVTAASGATIIPGSSNTVGSLTFNNNLTLNGQTLSFDVGLTGTGASDKLVVGGTLTLNGTSIISLNLPGSLLFNGTYTLITFGSMSGGTFALDKTYPGISLNNNSTSVTLTVTGGITSGGTSGVWTNLSAGNWTTVANWQNSIMAANTDALADFSTLKMTANNSVNINSTNITIGYMAFADLGQTYIWTLTGGTNTMVVSSGTPTITVATNSQANINSVLAGSQGLTVSGPGFLVLNGANTITNGINVLEGNLAIQSVKGLGATMVSSVNPVTCSNGLIEFVTSGAQYYTNDLYLLGATNQIYQGAAAQDSFVGNIIGSGTLQITTPGGVVLGQRGDMSGFKGTVLVTGNSSGNNAAGLILANGDGVTGISGSANAVWDYEGCTLNYLYSSSGITATNYMGALMGNNANVILQAKNGSGTTTGDVTTEVGALNTSTTFAGKFRDYVNSNTGTQPPKLGLRKVGTGTLTLSGASVNTGPTEVRNGRLTMSGSWAAPVTIYSGATFELSGSLGSAPVTVNSGATFLVDGGGTSASAAVAVNGLMDVTATGNYDLSAGSLSGSGVVKGAVTLSAATINPGPVGGAGTLTINNGDLSINGGTLAFDLSNDPTNGINDLLVVNGNLNLYSPATVSINKLVGALGGGNYPLFKFSGSLNGSLNNLTLLGAGPLDTLQQNGNEIDLVVSAVPTVVWTGGTAGNFWDVTTSTNWLLNGVKTTFTNGDAALFNDSGATNPVVTVPSTVLPAAVVVSSSSNYTFAGTADISNGASLTKSGTGSLTILNANTYIGGTFLSGGTLKLGDGVTQNGSVVGNIADNATLVFANPADQSFGGIIGGPGALLKQGAGTLTLTATNTLAGPTTISVGTLALGDGASMSGLLGSGAVTVNSQLALNEPSATTINNNITGTGAIDNQAPGAVTLAGEISGSCSLTNDFAAGLLYLTSSNNYSGGTVINAGAVIVSDPVLHGVGTGNIVINDGSGSIWFSSGGSNVLANNIQLPTSTTADQFLLPGISTVRLTGLLTGGAAGQITRFVNLSASGDNRGMIILDNPANSFTTIPETYFGTLAFTSDGALGNPTNAISVNVGNKVNTQFYSRADDGLRFAANNITLNPNRGINLVGNENINVQNYNGTIAGPITGFALNKRGAGTLTINGAGSLSNLTTVVAGTLVLNNVWAGSNVTVNSGATLAGTGSINAAVQISSGATLTIGTPSTATLTVTSNLVLSAGSTTALKINAATATSDRIAGIGAVSFDGTLVVSNLGGTPAVGQTYHLFTAASYSGNFATLSLPSAGPGNGWQWDPTTGTLSVQTSVATTPTNIVLSTSGGNLNLSWPADHIGWRLMSNSVNLLNTNFWFPVPGSETTNQVSLPRDASKANVFFRLAYP